MASAKPLSRKKNLLLCLDAFGTLFRPKIPIAVAYARAAARHEINVGDTDEVATRFRAAFKQESQKNPNYGKATGLGAKRWWSNIIESTFSPFLAPQPFPHALTTELLHRFSSSKGYTLYSDVKPFFAMLRGARNHPTKSSWPWDKTIVGIISNSDSRIPGILSSFNLSISLRSRPIPSSAIWEISNEHDIHFVTLSYDVGFEKPAPEIFHAAEDILMDTLPNLYPHLTVEDFEKLYVGDDLEKDYYGAERAGWGRVLLRRDADEGDGGGKGIHLAPVKNKQGKLRFVDTAGSLMDLGGWRPKEST
jgi:FMN phosphatase YigB (HAD superfamily)